MPEALRDVRDLPSDARGDGITVAEQELGPDLVTAFVGAPPVNIARSFSLDADQIIKGSYKTNQGPENATFHQ